MTVEEMRVALQEPFFDSSLVKHGFAAFFRDYDVIIEVNASQFLYRFSHCVSVTIASTLTYETWRESWDDSYIDYSRWQKAGSPDGYVWGVCYLAAYPGATYVEESALAREWTKRLNKQMHEVRIKTNAQLLELIFHDLSLRELQEDEREWVKPTITD